MRLPISSSFKQSVRLGAAFIFAASLSLPAQADTAPPLEGEMRDFILLEPAMRAPAAAFENAEGQSVNLDDFRGQVVLLNFWATWCAPCVREMPELDKLQADLGGAEFQVVAVSLDRAGFDAVGPFFANHGLENLPVYLDQDQDLQDEFGISGLPVTFLIDREGRVVGGFAGAADWAGAEARALIEHYLAAPETKSES